MEAEYQHKILVVDNDERMAKTIGKQLETEGLKVALTDCSQAALKQINETQKPFSIIISDQRSDEGPDSLGTEFLKQAKKITPDSQRFLLTACSDTQIIINAVNKGAIQRYIPKPWDHKLLIKAIQQGLNQFEHCLEHDKLLGLAKEQNSKLYDLNCEFMEKAKAHNSEQHTLKKEIKRLETLISDLKPTDKITLDDICSQIENSIKNDSDIDSEKMTQLFSETTRVLFKQFNEIAARNGFEMPLPKGSIPC